MSQKSLKEGGIGSDSKQEGPLVDGCVVLEGDTTALSAEVASGDNAHSDNQQGSGRRELGHCGLGTASGTAYRPCGSVLQGDLLPMVTPIRADQAHRCTLGLGWTQGSLQGCRVRTEDVGKDSLQALHHPDTKKAP